jgi:translation initiation factor 2 subunit 1
MSSPGLPEVGEVVVATVSQITPYGAYVTLDEYHGQRGFLHTSEISTGWVRHIDRYIKEDQKVVLKVIRVDRQRNEVDLSLRQVTSEEHKAKLIQVKREAKARGILDIVKKELAISDDSAIRAKLLDEFGSLYDALESCAKKGPSALAKLDIDQRYADALVKVIGDRFKIPSVEIKGTFEITSSRSDGVKVIKEAFAKAMQGVQPEVKVEVQYAGAPRYHLRLYAENFKVGERALSAFLERLKSELGNRASLNFIREKS